MAKFIKDEMVKFERNQSVKLEQTKIIAVVDNYNNNEIKQSYIIEHEIGWIPNNIRLRKFELDITKKYLFVSEDELTAI